MTESSFGTIVRERRQALGLTQAELARRVGCATVTIRKIEYDTLRPSVQIAERLALALTLPEAEQLAFVRLARAEPPIAPLPTPPPAPDEIGQADLSGRAIRGFELSERLGAGGFGVVYRASQPTVEREVAIKLILPRYADQPDFIRRFETEAQLVARLEHPHIVPLYDYWREPGAAYLIMRLLRGGNLEDLLTAGPLSPEVLLPMLQQVGAALHTAHRAGVIHRDIKPANILLDDDRNAYLADFGIAKQLIGREAEPGAVVGSPAYFSPEQIQAEPVRPQSDIYSLGVMLFELLTGHKPFPGPTPLAYIQQHLADALPPLATYRPELPAGLDAVLARATNKTAANRYPDVPALLTDFRQAVTSAATLLPPLPAEAPPELANPYKGLRPFAEADAGDFFGRDTFVQALLSRLSTEDDLARFLAVIGPSGSGKSSAVRAGLLPALRRGGLPGSEQWFITDMLPGQNPLDELAAALLRVAVNPPANLPELLRHNEHGLLRVVNRILPPDPAVELVLVIDQFEELFTLTEDEAARVHFLDSLVTALLDEQSRVRVILTMRADFLDHPLRYVDFGDILRQRTELILPLSPDELEEAITQPAAKQGLVLEPGLAADITRDVGSQPGALPLLQYALTELAERREGRLLTRAAYQASGGVTGALARRAEEIFAGLDAAGQQIARQLFLRLVAPGEGAEDTRRRVLRSELESLVTGHWSLVGKSNPNQTEQLTTDHGQLTIDQFGKYRLLTFDRDPASRAPTVEVAHEALIREWGRLRDWLADSRHDVRQQRQLAAAAQAWQEAAQDDSFLLHGTRLAQFEAWADETQLALNLTERAYLDASRAERDRQQAEEDARRRRELETAQKLAKTEHARAEEQEQSARRLRGLAVGLALFLLVAVGAAWLAFNQRAIAQTNQAQAEANFTRAEAQRLAAEANTLVPAGGNAEVIALLAVKSLGTQYSPQGDAALQAAAGLDYPRHTLTGHEAAIWAVAFAPDGQTVLSGSADGTARLWDAASGRQLQEFRGHEDEVNSVAFAPDGRTVLTGSADRSARLWDVKTGQELRQFSEPDGSGVSVAFAQDGQSALTGSYLGGVLHRWDVETGALQQTFTTSDAPEINGVAFSPDGRQVAAALGVGQIVRLWDTASGELLQTFTGSSDGVLAVAFSPDGQTLVSGGYDKSARLWDIVTGGEIRRFEGHTDAVESVSFSPDGRTLITASDDGTARLWDVSTGQELRHLAGHTNPVSGAAFAPDGKTIATASFDQTIKLWGSQLQPEYSPLAGVINSFSNAIKFTADGRSIAGVDETGLGLWDVQTGQLVHQYNYDSPLASAAISPDGSLVLGGAGNGVLVGWDAHTGEKLFSLTGHQVEVQSVAISPDGRYALTAGASDGTARLWDLSREQAIQVFSPEAGIILDTAFSPDGRYALAAGMDSRVLMWAVEGGQLVRTFELAGPVGAPSVAVSPDGQQVAVGTRVGEIALFDLESGQQQKTFTGHTAGVRDLAFSPDGKLLLSGSVDGTARLWEIRSGVELRRYNRRPFTVHSVAFAPDGRTVLVAASNGLALRYDIDYEETVAYLCGRLQRDFSDDERMQYEITGEVATCQRLGNSK
ncbi:MAG: hypothetical protein Kow0031_11260 [Anaerolineae bacterium]